MPILILRSHLHPSPWARRSGYAACAGLGREVNMNKRTIAHVGIGIQAENRPDAISQRGPYRRMNLLPIKTNGNFPLWLIFKRLSCKSLPILPDRAADRDCSSRGLAMARRH